MLEHWGSHSDVMYRVHMLEHWGSHSDVMY